MRFIRAHDRGQERLVREREAAMRVTYENVTAALQQLEDRCPTCSHSWIAGESDRQRLVELAEEVEEVAESMQRRLGVTRIPYGERTSLEQYRLRLLKALREAQR